jgi:hypothetical protein
MDLDNVAPAPDNETKAPNPVGSAHTLLDMLIKQAVDGELWGWIYIGVRFRAGKVRQITRQYEASERFDDPEADS